MKKFTLYDFLNRSDEFLIELGFISFLCSTLDKIFDVSLFRLICFLCLAFVFCSIGYFIRVEELEDMEAK